MAEAATIPRTPAPAIASGMRTGPFLIGWGLAWALIGCAVAGAMVLVGGLPMDAALQLSVLFAEVVGLTSLVAARVVFPMFTRMPYAISLLLQLVTVLAGTVVGSIAVIALEPLLFVNRYETVALIVLVNAALAAIVGIALFTYDTMRRQIEQSYETQRQKEALDRELSIARDVQQQLLPLATPELPDLELTGICRPAISVGGDYFDFLQLGDQELGLVIADVSGKGIPAALLMAGLQASVRSLTRPKANPATLTARINDIVFRSSSASRYATMFLGFYDGTTRQLVYSNAGHLPPLLVGGRAVTRLDAGGMPVGMFPGVEYACGRCELSPGDVLALFTDGVVEQPNAEGEEFGESRLLALLQRYAGEPLETVAREVLEGLDRFSGGTETHDDVTLVLARVR